MNAVEGFRVNAIETHFQGQILNWIVYFGVYRHNIYIYSYIFNYIYMINAQYARYLYPNPIYICAFGNKSMFEFDAYKQLDQICKQLLLDVSCLFFVYTYIFILVNATWFVSLLKPGNLCVFQQILKKIIWKWFLRFLFFIHSMFYYNDNKAIFIDHTLSVFKSKLYTKPFLTINWSENIFFAQPSCCNNLTVFFIKIQTRYDFAEIQQYIEHKYVYTIWGLKRYRPISPHNLWEDTSSDVFFVYVFAKTFLAKYKHKHIHVGDGVFGRRTISQLVFPVSQHIQKYI